MDTGFPNKLEPKPGEKKKSPWDFTAPPYDERSSCYVNAGTKYGVGHRNPIGHSGNPKSEVPCLPKTGVKKHENSEIYTGRPETFEVKE